MDKNKKIIWITGGSRGIGKALAESFVKNNDIVIISSRNIQELQKTADLYCSKKNVCNVYQCDVSDEKQVKDTFSKIQTKFDGVDILINNAGIGIFKDVVNTSLEEFKNQIDANLIGTFLCSKAVLPSMMEKSSGQIINIVSVAAKKPFTGSGTYGATKAGVLMLTKVLREEVKKYNIKVVAVIPGATSTEIWSPKLREKFGKVMMKPQDVADAVFNICQQPSGMITEEIILRPINGDLN